MCTGKGTIQCAVGMGLANVPSEWGKPICSVNGTIQCALGMGLVKVGSASPGIHNSNGRLC